MKRILAGGGTIGVAWKVLAIGLVAASLIGLAFQFQIVQMPSIQTQGVTTPRLSFDGLPMTEAVYDAPSDTFSDGKLDAGETETFSHYFASPADDGDWDVAWNTQEFMTWFHTPSAPEFGYSFNTTDTTGTNISYVTVMHGDNKEVRFVHHLDSHFDQENAPADGIPYKLVFHVYPFVAPPTAVDDQFVTPWRTATVIYPLANDIGSGLYITAVSGVMGNSQATINQDGSITYFHDSTLGETFTYTVCSGAPLYKTDTAIVTTTIA